MLLCPRCHQEIKPKHMATHLGVFHHWRHDQIKKFLGSVAERFKAPALKPGGPKGSARSNRAASDIFPAPSKGGGEGK